MTYQQAHRQLATLAAVLDESAIRVADIRLAEDVDLVFGDQHVHATVDVYVPLDEPLGLSASAGSDPSSMFGNEVVDVESEDRDEADGDEVGDGDEPDQEDVEDAEDVQEDSDEDDTADGQPDHGGNGGGPDVPAASTSADDLQDDVKDTPTEPPSGVREDLTDLQTEVVDALAEGGEQSASDLQTATGQNSGIYSRLSALEEKGVIATREDPDDARRSLYSLATRTDDVGEDGDDDGDDTDEEGADAAADEDGAGEDQNHRIGDELDEADVDGDEADDQEASADGGAVTGRTQADLDLPGDATAEDVHDLIEALGPKPYLGEIADELGIERSRARTVAHELDRYGDVIDAPQYKGGGD